jgi:Protein of unknown function (DUF2796)
MFLFRLATFLISLALAVSAWAGKGHEHGVAALNVAVEGQRLTLELLSPLDNLLGFERAPRNAAERQAVAELLARLQGAVGLFAPDAKAQCRFSSAEVNAPQLQPKPPSAPGAKPPPAAPEQADHDDLEATWVYVCAQAQHLRSLDVALFDAFKRLQRLDVQVAGEKAQSKATLKRPARVIKLLP